MNPDTLVAISCYSGDTFRIENALALGLLTHHECPIVLLSPAALPGVIQPYLCRNVGPTGVWGQPSLDRWDLYFKELLKFPQNYFLICDSDSYCLSPELPRRFYKEPDVFWSFHHPDPRPHPSPYPKIAFQSPLFLSRSSIEKLLSVDRAKVPCHPITPFQDWYLVALTCECGNLEYRHNPDAVSFPGWNGGGANRVVDGFVSDENYRGADRMVDEVLSGKILVHSVRHREVLQRVVDARRAYVRFNPS